MFLNDYQFRFVDLGMFFIGIIEINFGEFVRLEKLNRFFIMIIINLYNYLRFRRYLQNFFYKYYLVYFREIGSSRECNKFRFYFQIFVRIYRLLIERD